MGLRAPDAGAGHFAEHVPHVQAAVFAHGREQFPVRRPCAGGDGPRVQEKGLDDLEWGGGVGGGGGGGGVDGVDPDTVVRCAQGEGVGMVRVGAWC